MIGAVVYLLLNQQEAQGPYNGPGLDLPAWAEPALWCGLHAAFVIAALLGGYYGRAARMNKRQDD